MTNIDPAILSGATAEYNIGDFDDESAWICEPEEVCQTSETLENLISARGTPHETKKTKVGTLLIWNKQQSAKGKVRGSLFLLDVGDVRLSYFSGEV